MTATGMVSSKISGNLMSLGAIDFGLIVGDLGHAAADSAAGDDLVALLDRRDRRLMFLHALLLRADHHEIHDAEEQDDQKQRRETATALRLSCVKHEDDLPDWP